MTPHMFVSRSMNRTAKCWLTQNEFEYRPCTAHHLKGSKEITCPFNQNQNGYKRNKPIILSEDFLECPPRIKSLVPHLTCQK